MMSSQQYCLRWNNHRSIFEELLHNAAFTDVTLAIDEGRTIKCHKIVLAACSTYFQTLFHQLSGYNHHPIIILKDVGFPVLKAILEYMYRGEVNVAHEQLSDLLKIAQLLKVKGLVEEHGTSDTPNTSHDLRPEDTSPPPDISTSTNTGGSGGVSHSSPPSYYSLYGNDRSNHLASLLPSTWLLHSTGHQLPTSLSGNGGSSNNSGSYDNGIEISPFKRRKMLQPPPGLLINNDTPILRTVLGQAHVDSSQALPLLQQPDSHEPFNYRNANSNGSANDSDNRRNNDLVHGETTVHADASYADEDERQPSPQSYPDTARNSAVADCVQPKPEWKRYKQYTRDDISAAIEAVRKGMSAVQAARKYGVPSRTLYDKVKKLGIPTSRPFKRSASNGGSGACFPYGIGANVNGALYDNSAGSANALSENENESNIVTESLAGTSAAVFEATHPKTKDLSRDLMSDSMARCSSSPVIRCVKQRQQQQQQQDLDDQVEDLSVSRKSDVPVIVPPSATSTAIKDETQETGLDSNDCCDYS
ncbi:PREDICTED: longitudinals lacking protein, isoforms N/O/W/X/Y [Acromyrmex echinatior]|uniref:Protein tramtrack, alpha isoform n=1 Tax=Acromyrmex echinatior TaxID=103372 RepID=F4X7T4_ACREC|nr:PREDICTED: longitudinals lacking protein, isoforms N/O/W/X/Y [Acromyrmex echinatior]EGI57490.1 Protein tramtrack, alpha isoform [Acromyrmex echinatior]